MLHINDDKHYIIRMGLGTGTNATIITLRHLLHFSIEHECHHLQIFEDARNINNWFNIASKCHIQTLFHILEDLWQLITQFESISCCHIYRECNQISHAISKEATRQPQGRWMIDENNGHEHFRYYHRLYIYQHRIAKIQLMLFWLFSIQN